jgi:predicted DNA-binding protein with PD1-like motif
MIICGYAEYCENSPGTLQYSRKEALMSRIIRSTIVNFAALAAVALFVCSAAAPLGAQQPPQHRQFPPLPPGYVRPPMSAKPGLAPKMRVVELPTADSKTYEVTFGKGDEIMSGLNQFAEEHHIVSAHITGIGGLISAKLGWGSPTLPAMKEIDVNSKCELVSLIGNISEFRGHPYVHVHAVVAFSDGSTKGGHVIEAHVDPIAEIYVVTTAAPLPPKAPASPSGLSVH